MQQVQGDDQPGAIRGASGTEEAAASTRAAKAADSKEGPRTYGPDERIKGGPASRDWLKDVADLRHPADDYWRPGMNPQSLDAYETVKAAFPGFDYEVVRWWDPKLRRELQEHEVVKGFHCKVRGQGRLLREEEIYEGDVLRGGIKVSYSHGEDPKPLFEWVGPSGRPVKSFVRFVNYPLIDGNRPSMADLVRLAREELNVRVELFEPEIERRMAPVIELGSLGVAYVQMLTEGVRSGRLFHLPRDPRVVGATAAWLCAARKGEEVTVVSFICPDWATKDEGGMERYTFEAVNGGVGLVARRAIPGILRMAAFARARELNIRFAVVVGDFEGLSAETQERLGLDFEGFRAYTHASLEAMRHELVESDSWLAGRIVTHQATDLVGGVDAWNALLVEKAGAVTQVGLAKTLGVDDRVVANMCAARQSLYERWYGSGCDVQQILDGQAPEYGAMGEQALRSWQHPLIIAADARVMHRCFNMLQDSTVPGLSIRGGAY